MEMITEGSVIKLIESISSNAPIPGGGAVSALSASIAVSLCEMVVGLTVGKKRYNEYDEATQNKINKIAEEAREMKGVFLNLFEKDNQAFEKVMEAMKLPKETDEEKAYRKQKIEEGYIGAMEVPLTVAQKMVAFLGNIEFMIQKGNPNCITDGAVAALQGQAAIEGTIMNVKINLSGLSDANLVEKTKTECERILAETQKTVSGIKEYVNAKL